MHRFLSFLVIYVTRSFLALCFSFRNNCDILSLSILQQVWYISKNPPLFRRGKTLGSRRQSIESFTCQRPILLLWDYWWQNLSLLTGASFSLLHISYFWLSFQIVLSRYLVKRVIVKLGLILYAFLISLLCVPIYPTPSSSTIYSSIVQSELDLPDIRRGIRWNVIPIGVLIVYKL